MTRTEIQATAGAGGLVAADQHRHVQRPGGGRGGGGGWAEEVGGRICIKYVIIDCPVICQVSVSPFLLYFVSCFEENIVTYPGSFIQQNPLISPLFLIPV